MRLIARRFRSAPSGQLQAASIPPLAQRMSGLGQRFPVEQWRAYLPQRQRQPLPQHRQPPPRQVRATLCKADWSRGLDGWVGTPDWKAINGMLVNDGTNGADLETSPSLLAPCDLGGVANFTLEATIQVTSQGYDPGFDFFVRYTKPDQGYILGVTDQYNAANSLSGVTCTTADRFYQPIQTANFVPGGGFHTYVVTLSGDHIRLLIDNHVYLDVTDSQVASGPLIGLTDKDARLIVSSLSVIRG